MQRVIVEHDFTLPPERVFAYLSEHEHLGALFGARIRRIKDGDDGQRNGGRPKREVKGGPLPPYEETITEVVPGELIRYRITKGGILRDHEGVTRFSPRGTGTRLRYEISFAGKLPGIDRVVKHSLQRSIGANLGEVDRKG